MRATGLRWAALIFAALVCRVTSELYSAIAGMESLLEGHANVVHVLTDYIRHEEERLSFLKWHLKNFKQEHHLALQDVPNYLGNPINAFTLMKRLTRDLDDIQHTIRRGAETSMQAQSRREGLQYPEEEDLLGAAQALYRLQKVYHLEIPQLAQGELRGVPYSQPMTASDCFELARSMYALKHYDHALLWTQEALWKLDNQSSVYEGYTYDNFVTFVKFLKHDIDQTLVALAHLRPQLGAQDHSENSSASSQAALPTRQPKILEEETTREDHLFESVCRGDLSAPAHVLKDLRCSYLSEGNDFLKLAPLKAEQVYRQPDVYVFHQVLSEREIEEIQNITRPQLARATVFNDVSGEDETSLVRVSQVAWVYSAQSAVARALERRTADMTGLSIKKSEPLQVLNYGIGGHYSAHLDFARLDDELFLKEDGLGNRVATVLYYMSDVPQGGATAFPELGVAVTPKKGSALYWRNLHPSGEGDLATLHGACPVLRGSKWLMTKWIRELGQQLTCGLEYQREGFAGELPSLEPASSS